MRLNVVSIIVVLLQNIVTHDVSQVLTLMISTIILDCFIFATYLKPVTGDHSDLLWIICSSMLGLCAIMKYNLLRKRSLYLR